MSIISRFFGRKETVFERGLVANPELDTPLSLRGIFKSSFKLNISEIKKI